MYIQTLRLAIIAAAIIFAVPALAQDCGCGGPVSYGVPGDGGCGFGAAGDNCGRSINQQQAESLWAGYCTENCAYPGGGSKGGCGGRKLFGRCGSGGGCGCDSGCFGYPTGGGCGGGGKLFGGCKLGSRHGGGCGGGCQLGSRHSSDCGGGFQLSSIQGSSCGGCGGKLKRRHAGCGGCKLFGGCKKFGHSAQQCGTSGAYFDEAVGYEYGTSGIQSCVSCNTCGSFDSLVSQVAAPAMMSAPYTQPQNPVETGLPTQNTTVPSAPMMSEPVVGAIEAVN